MHELEFDVVLKFSSPTIHKILFASFSVNPNYQQSSHDQSNRGLTSFSILLFDVNLRWRFLNKKNIGYFPSTTLYAVICISY